MSSLRALQSIILAEAWFKDLTKYSYQEGNPYWDVCFRVTLKTYNQEAENRIADFSILNGIFRPMADAIKREKCGVTIHFHSVFVHAPDNPHFHGLFKVFKKGKTPIDYYCNKFEVFANAHQLFRNDAWTDAIAGAVDQKIRIEYMTGETFPNAAVAGKVKRKEKCRHFSFCRH